MQESLGSKIVWSTRASPCATRQGRGEEPKPADGEEGLPPRYRVLGLLTHMLACPTLAHVRLPLSMHARTTTHRRWLRWRTGRLPKVRSMLLFGAGLLLPYKDDDGSPRHAKELVAATPYQPSATATGCGVCIVAATAGLALDEMIMHPTSSSPHDAPLWPVVDKSNMH